MDSRGGEAGTAGQKTARRRRNRSGKRRNNKSDGQGVMTKNGRRNHRKKSCSSLESTSNAESVGKENQGKEKGAKDVHVPAVQAAPKSQHSAKGETIRGWFSSLSWEDRASVTSVEDTAFVTTLLDLASSLSSPHHSSGTLRLRGWSTGLQ